MKTKELIYAELYVDITEKVYQWNPKSEQTSYDFQLLADLDKINWAIAKNAYKMENIKWVKVCLSTRNNIDSNWIKDGIDGYDDLKDWKPIKPYLPSYLFENYKEGDTITLEIPVQKQEKNNDIIITNYTKIKLSVTLSQNKHKYKEIGNFQEALTFVGC